MEINVALQAPEGRFDGHQCPRLGMAEVEARRPKEAVMEGHGAVETLLARVRDWWRRQSELSYLDDKELGRVAAELGMSSNALEDLVERGPEAAHNLYERMRVLGLSKADVDAAAHGALRDLQRTCACCNDKGVCEKDLAKRPDNPVWKSYCPNAVTLETLAKLKTHSPT
jgi:hypothetical protein